MRQFTVKTISGKLVLASLAALALTFGMTGRAGAQVNGTLVGSPTFTAGKFSNALTLNGSQDVTFPSANGPFADSTIMASGKSWTVEAWIKTTATGLQVAFGVNNSFWIGENGGNLAVLVCCRWRQPPQYERSHQRRQLASCRACRNGRNAGECFCRWRVGLRGKLDACRGPTERREPAAWRLSKWLSMERTN